jgi:hypothetical protein
MNARFVAEDVGKTVGTFAGIGLVVGLLAALLNERGRLADQAHVRTHIPARVAGVSQLKDNLLVLAGIKSPDKNSLQRVIRRCDSLIEMVIAVDGADPSTVKPSLSAAASAMEASIVKYLLQFYTLSNVALIREQEGERPNRLVPVNRDLREAHQVIRQVVEGVAHELKKRVKDKLELKSMEASTRRSLHDQDSI